MKKVVLTDPSYDRTTQVLSSWIAQTAAYIDSLNGKKSIHVKGSSVKVAKVDKILIRHKPALVTFSGHGEDDRLFDHKHEILYDSTNDHSSLKDMIVHAVACSSGKQLGGVMVKNGIKGFVGFEDEFRFHYTTGDVDDPMANLFLEPTYHVTRSLAEGKSVGESWAESQKMFKKNYLAAAVAKADIDVLANLMHNMKYHVTHGDLDAQLT